MKLPFVDKIKNKKLKISTFVLIRLVPFIIISAFILNYLQNTYLLHLIEEVYFSHLSVISSDVEHKIAHLLDVSSSNMSYLQNKGILLDPTKLGHDEDVLSERNVKFVLKVDPLTHDYEFLYQNKNSKLLNLTFLNQYRQFLSSEFVYSYIIKDKSTDTPWIISQIKVDDALLIYISACDFSTIFDNTTVPLSNYSFTVHDSLNNILYQSDSALDYAEFSVSKDFYTNTISEKLRLEIYENKAGGKYYYYESRFIQNSYYIDVLLEASVLDAFILRSNYYIVAFLILQLLILGLITQLLSKKIAKPLHALNQLFELRKGNVSDSKNIESSGLIEIDTTIENFNVMDDIIIKKEQDLREFAYIASHDLQEPLRTIHNYVEIIKDELGDQFDEDLKLYFNHILEGSDRMKHLILDLLEYSRSGRLLNLVDVDLNQVIHEIINNNKTLIEETQAKITFNRLPQIVADKALITELISNLIRNAIKFRKKDQSPIIQINYCDNVLYIKDYGIGIDSVYFDEIFKPFRKLHPAHLYAGSGIGLALCKKISDSHQFSLNVESELNQYTLFKIEFTR